MRGVAETSERLHANIKRGVRRAWHSGACVHAHHACPKICGDTDPALNLLQIFLSVSWVGVRDVANINRHVEQLDLSLRQRTPQRSHVFGCALRDLELEDLHRLETETLPRRARELKQGHCLQEIHGEWPLSPVGAAHVQVNWAEALKQTPAGNCNMLHMI